MEEQEDIMILAAQLPQSQAQIMDPAISLASSPKKKSKKTRVSKKKMALMVNQLVSAALCSPQVGRADPQLQAFKLIYRKALATQSNMQLYGREQLPTQNQFMHSEAHSAAMETMAAERSIRDLRGMYNLAFQEDTLAGASASPAIPTPIQDYVSSTCAPYFYDFIEAYLKCNKPT